MLEGPLQSNRTPTIAGRAIFGIFKSCRNRGSHFLQSTGLWLNCGKSTTLLQFRPIRFDCDDARPSDKTSNPSCPIGTSCKPQSHRSPYDCMRLSIQAQFWRIEMGTMGLYNSVTLLDPARTRWLTQSSGTCLNLKDSKTMAKIGSELWLIQQST